MRENRHTQVQCKCELKDGTINLYQKIIVEQFNVTFNVTLMRDHLLICLQLEKFFTICKDQKKRFIAVDLFLCFLMCIVSAKKPTLMMILNQMTGILWQNAAAMASGTTRSA